MSVPASPEAARTEPEVRRRCVFYVSGFDPKGAAHYHALYRDQSALQARAGGLEIEVGPRRREPGGNDAWTVRAVEDGMPVETRYEFLRWDDIVRAHWPRREWQLWRDMLATSWHNLRCGALWRIWKLSWPAGAALTLPIALLLLALVVVPAFSVLLGLAAWTWTASLPASLAATALSWAALAAGARHLEARYSMYWMMRSYAFTRRQVGGIASLEARLDAFAGRIAGRVRENVDDEVLVAAHSSGPVIAASALARALDELATLADEAPRPVLSFLSLGQCIPILGLLPQADRFRRELAVIAQSPLLDEWLDFSAPPDGCCFALTDPLAACAVHAPKRQPERPKLLSPRFMEMFDATTYAALKRDKFRMHFQYLMAGQRPADFDYFRITAGRRTLRARFAHVPGVVNYTGLRPSFAR
jgi:hypothetical protein